MTRRYYDATSLERVLTNFETRYGLSSTGFYEMHVSDTVPEDVTGRHRHVWASFYRDVMRLRGALN